MAKHALATATAREGKAQRPVAALFEDLDQRGLLDETLVVWVGKFGRTPTMEGLGNDRNHNPPRAHVK